MPEEIGINITTEQRIISHKGVMYSNAVSGKSFWLPYTEIFDWVRIIARVQPVDTLPDTALPLTDERIKFGTLPNFQGPIWMMPKIPHLWSRLKSIASDNSAYLLWVPGAISSLLYWHLRARKWPYAVAVVGDPFFSLSPQAIGSKWSYIAQPLAVQMAKRQCHHAAAAYYVTENVLQNRYPTKAEYVAHFSNVILSDDLLLEDKHKSKENKLKKADRQYRLIFVGSLSQRYKGLHVLLQALKLCLSQGLKITLNVVGDGQYRKEYEQMASDLEVKEHVNFLGFVKQGPEVFELMHQSDLFVMPSLVEGLPRAMIEAMACGLPCIGSRIGGIPELLESKDMVPPGDPQALAGKIAEVLGAPHRMVQSGEKNRRLAWEKYHPDDLREKRRSFLESFRNITIRHKQKILQEVV